MKKTLSALLVATLIFSLTGCVAREESSSSKASPSSGSSVPSSAAPSSSSLPEPSSSSSSSSSESPSAVPTMSADFAQLATLGTAPVQWGPSTQMDEKNRPIACLGLQEKYGKYNAHFIAPESPNIYLTFDEGYENGYTGKILDILKEKEVPAVFFVTMDYAKRQPELVRRMIDEGHVVGNHSTTHPIFSAIPIEKAFEEVDLLHKYVQEQFGYTMNLFRYPTGEFNEQSLGMLDDIGYQSVFWSFAYADWDPKKQPEPTAALGKITKAAHPGAIYLLHAVSDTNTQILPSFVDTLREQGYVFAKMGSEL